MRETIDAAAGRSVFVATDVRMHYDSAGQLRGNHAAGEYSAWTPYLAAFGSMTLVARLHRDTIASDGPITTGPGVTFAGVRPYEGLFGLISKLPGLLHDFAQIGSRGDVFIGRLPEPLSILAWLRAKRLRAKYVSLVVADPSSLLRSGVGGLTGRLTAPPVSLSTRFIVKHSNAVIYVSDRWLQSRYPSAAGTPVLARSNVRLSGNSISTNPRPRDSDRATRTVHLISLGSMTNQVKGHHILIQALSALQQQGIRSKLSLVGDGKERDNLELSATRSGVDVRFLGQLHNPQHIVRELDSADIYVTASRSEGLSRAVVEAMARGLPVVATEAGAIDELIDPAYIVPIDDVNALVSAIKNLVLDPIGYERESARNLARAREIANRADPDRLTSFLREYV